MTQPNAADNQAVTTAPGAPAPGVESPPLRVLLVADHPGDARLVRELLAEMPAHILLDWTDSLGSALRALAHGRMEALLVDLALPDSQGLETLARLQAAAPGLPIVVLTGSADPHVAWRSVQAGAQDCLVKSSITGEMLVRAQDSNSVSDARQDLWAALKVAFVEPAEESGAICVNTTQALEYGIEQVIRALDSDKADQTHGASVTRKVE